MRGLLLLVVVVLALGVAHADTVQLTNGRKLYGEIVEENDKEVVLKAEDGEARVPRSLIRSIERQSATVNRLNAALILARAGDRRAFARFQQALDEAERAEDTKTAVRARDELAAFAERCAGLDRAAALSRLTRARELASELVPSAIACFEEAIALSLRAGDVAMASSA